MLQTITFYKINITYTVKFLILLTLATAAPLVGLHSQWLTGPIVNMALILAVYLLGIRGALLIGILPSTIALGSGLLPAILSPMIPFIIISNTLLILIIDYFIKFTYKRKLIKKYSLGLFFAASIKYLFLFITSDIVISLLFKQSIATKVSQLMSWPQFFTAIIGGILAWGALKFLKNKNDIQS